MQLTLYERTVIGLAGGFGFVGFALVVMAYANDWWLSAIVTVSIIVWLAGVLLAFYCRPGERVLALGGLIAGFLYILLALGPWFQTNVGPWLLTTRAFAYIETQMLRREQPQPAVVYQTMASPYGFSGYGNPNVWTSYPPQGGSPVLVNVPTFTGRSTFAAVGHWLTAWVCAGIGALAAGWIARRSQPPAADTALSPESPPNQPAGENPFLERAL